MPARATIIVVAVVVMVMITMMTMMTASTAEAVMCHLDAAAMRGARDGMVTRAEHALAVAVDSSSAVISSKANAIAPDEVGATA